MPICCNIQQISNGVVVWGGQQSFKARDAALRGVEVNQVIIDVNNTKQTHLKNVFKISGSKLL